MLIDLHIHTSYGSGDSNLSIDELVIEASRIGLEGACLTEHNKTWVGSDLDLYKKENPRLFFVGAMEVETNMGHITVYGLKEHPPKIWDILELRKVSEESGAFMVSAHPFRKLFNSGKNDNLLFREQGLEPIIVETAAAHPVFQYVDAIEINGSDTGQEKEFTMSVAQYLSKPAVGGSDVHSVNGLGACVTVFSQKITSEESFLEALHEGCYYPAIGLREGNLRSISLA
jgi:predicted metal-dependent phosphoesterase TrpH